MFAPVSRLIIPGSKGLRSAYQLCRMKKQKAGTFGTGFLADVINPYGLMFTWKVVGFQVMLPEALKQPAGATLTRVDVCPLSTPAQQ